MLYFKTQPFDYHPIIALHNFLSLLQCRLSPRLSCRAKSVMNIQKKVTSEGPVNCRPQNLHKLSYSKFGFQYYWLMSPASYTVILPLHLSWPHDPHCEYPFWVILTFSLFLVLEIFFIFHVLIYIGGVGVV